MVSIFFVLLLFLNSTGLYLEQSHHRIMDGKVNDHIDGVVMIS